jgi:alpha-1,2-mannosyltransferase
MVNETAGRGIWGLRVLGSPGGRAAAVLLFMGILAARGVAAFIAFGSSPVFGYDFAAYRLAAERLLAGVPLYGPDMLNGPYLPLGHLLFLYPPPAALLATPSLLTSLATGSTLWAVLDLVALAAGLVWVVRLVPWDLGLRSAALRWLLLALAVAGFSGAAGEYLVGNVDGPLVLLSAAVLWSIKRRETAGSALVGGLAVGLATTVKVFPVLLIVWLFAERRWRTSAIALGAIGILALATLPWAGSATWTDYLRALSFMAPTLTADSASVLATVSPFVDLHIAQAFIILAWLIALRRQRRDIDRQFGLTMMTMLLLSPATPQHYLVLALPALWILLSRTQRVTIGLATYLGLWAEPRLLPIIAQVGLFAALLFLPDAPRTRPVAHPGSDGISVAAAS